MDPILPVEVVERIGRHIPALRNVGMWNQVFAFRHRGIPVELERMTRYALAVPMISQSLIEGVYRAPDAMAYGIQDEQGAQAMHHADSSDDDSDDDYNTTRDYPLLHRVIMRTYILNITDRANIVKDIFARFPQVVDFEDAERNTPVHLVVRCCMDASVLRAFKAASDVDVWDKVLQMVNKLQQTPLNIALQHHAVDAIIRDLVDREENVLTRICALEHTPVQTLIVNMTDATDIAIFDMLKSKTNGLHPSVALTNEDKNHNTALHLLLKTANSPGCTISRIESLIPQLIDADQDVLGTTNRMDISLDSDDHFFYEKNTPVHTALQMAMPLAVIVQLGDTAGKVWTVKNHLGDTPLHTALRENTLQGQAGLVAPDVVSYLIEAVYSKHGVSFFRHYDKNGDTLLHFAIKNNATSPVLEHLVRLSDPWALGIRNDIQNNTPLHLALLFKREYALIKQMVQADSTVLSNTNMDGDTPLHVAIKNKASRDTIRALVEACPNVCIIKNNVLLAGEQERRAADTPFSLAIKGSYALDVVRLLADYDKSVLCSMDVHGETPVHAALQRGLYRHVKYIFEAAGDDLCDMRMDPDRVGRTPLNYVLETGNQDMDLIRLLLRHDEDAEDVMMYANGKERTPLHTALSMHMPRKIIKMLLPKTTDNLRTLLAAKDDKQYTPFNIAETAHVYNTKVLKLLTYTGDMP